MNEPHIHVGLTRRLRQPDGTIADVTINLSGIPVTASDDLIETMLGRAHVGIALMFQEAERRIESQRRQIPSADVNHSALDHNLAEGWRVDDAPIPDEDDVATDSSSYGVPVKLPAAHLIDQPITDAQLVAVNAGFGNAGFKDPRRKPACLLVLRGFYLTSMGNGVCPDGMSDRTRLGSTKDLTAAEASILIDWISNADGAAIDRLREEVDREIESEEPPLPLTDRINATVERLLGAMSGETSPREALGAASKDEANAPDSGDEHDEHDEDDEPVGEVVLSPGQREAYEAIVSAARAQEGGRFIFITGKAGTGKSTVLRMARAAVRCIVCAPTGLAAVNVGGTTIHRAFSFGVGPKTARDVGALSGAQAEVLRRARVIVVDEISMVRADTLDAIDVCLRKTLRTDRPFGGKTIVALGDLWQLEPVVENDLVAWFDKRYKSPFWFDAHVFDPPQKSLEAGAEPLAIERFELTDVFRQKGDPDFIDALNLVRVGDPAGLSKINRRAGVRPGTEEHPVVLCLTNAKAHAINDAKLHALATEPRVYEARIAGDWKENEHPVPQSIELRIGAQVMISRNMTTEDGEYVSNGAIGEVVAFAEDGPYVELRDGRRIVVTAAEWSKTRYAPHPEKDDELISSVEGTFAQIPIKLAWAITVHKAQGQTLDSAMVEFEQTIRTHGQAYVALSRVRSFDGLYLRRALKAQDLVVNPHVRRFCGVPEPVSAAVDPNALD